MRSCTERLRWLGRAWVGVVLLALCAPAGAEAQVRAGDVRLHLDLGLVNWTSMRTRGETFAGDDALYKSNLLLAGTTSGGIGVGYAVNAHIVPGLYFALQHAKSSEVVKTDDEERELREGTERRFELRPYLEVPFNPSSRFVLHGLVGLSLARAIREPGDFEAFAVGPVLGVGGHGFVTSKASLDFSLAFRTAFVKSDDLKDAAEAALDDVKLRELALIFSIGASFWL